MQPSSVQGIYKRNYNLSHLTWFKTGGCADLFFKPLNSSDLQVFLKEYGSTKPITVIGAGSNMIIRDGGVEGAVIKLANSFSNIELLDDDKLVVGASCLNYNLAKFCQANFIEGFEFLTGIPGTIGGGVIMNAGAYGREFKDIILYVEAIDRNGNILTIKREEINFSYRASNLPLDLIVTKAVLNYAKGDQAEIIARMNEISEKRIKTQPITSCTGGSTFANPLPNKAWELIDQCGLRGFKIGGASISTLHCNFMINEGNATSSELEELGEFVRNTVLHKTGISLEWEIKRVGKR